MIAKSIRLACVFAAGALVMHCIPPIPDVPDDIEDDVLNWLIRQQDASTGLVSCQEDDLANTYINSLAVIAFVMEGEIERAVKILDFFQDRFTDEFSVESEARGFFQYRSSKTGIHDAGDRWIGDNAWLCIAIKRYGEATGDFHYDPIARAIADLFLSFQQPDGYVATGWTDNDLAFDSTGHTEGNLDVYAALTLCGETVAAAEVKEWLDYSDLDWRWGPLDIHTMRVLAFGPAGGYCLQDLERTDRPEGLFKHVVDVRGSSVTGFSPFSSGMANIWVEGTGQACVSFYIAGYKSLADYYETELEKLAVDSTSFPGTKSLPFLALPDPAGYPWVDTSRGFSSSACWFLFSMRGYDPVRGTTASGSSTANPIGRVQAENYESCGGSVRGDSRFPLLEGDGIHMGGDDADPVTVDDAWIEGSFLLLESLDTASLRVRYADDIQGAPAGDVCTVKVDGSIMAAFNTNQYSTGTWDDYAWTDAFPAGSLASGVHSLRLEVVDGGSYGVTVDCLEILRE